MASISANEATTPAVGIVIVYDGSRGFGGCDGDDGGGGEGDDDDADDDADDNTVSLGDKSGGTDDRGEGQDI